jgi:DUF1365 family protein
MRSIPDTSPGALARQDAILRELAPEARLNLAVQMSESARSLLRARLRAAHADWTDNQITAAMIQAAAKSSALSSRRT